MGTAYVFSEIYAGLVTFAWWDIRFGKGIKVVLKYFFVLFLPTSEFKQKHREVIRTTDL